MKKETSKMVKINVFDISTNGLYNITYILPQSGLFNYEYESCNSKAVINHLN